MSSGGDVLRSRRPVLRAPPVAGVPPLGQAVPERVGGGDPGRTVRRGGDRPRAGLQAGPTGTRQSPAAGTPEERNETEKTTKSAFTLFCTLPFMSNGTATCHETMKAKLIVGY